MNARLLASLLVLASLAPACSPTQAPTSSTPATVQSTQANALIARPPIFDRMQMAPTTVRHGGTRRLEYHYEIAGIAQSLVYEERVTADGHGKFALDPLRLGEPNLTASQRELFDLVQKNREGFFFRYRDFGVRQRDLFLANYRIVDLKTNPIVAGRACMEIEVERVAAAQVKYHLAIDLETALVLRNIEIAPDGRELARVTFTDFTLDPVLTQDIQWFTPSHEGVPLDSVSLAAAGLGFVPLEPALLPVGYQHVQSEILRNGQDAWIRRIYSDGVEHIFLLQNGSHDNQDTSGADTIRPTRGSATQGASTAPIPPASYKIRIITAGPWTLAEVSRGDEQIFAIGKNEDDVLRLLKSLR